MYNIFVDFSLESAAELHEAERALLELKKKGELRAQLFHSNNKKKAVWFPRRMADLDTFASKVRWPILVGFVFLFSSLNIRCWRLEQSWMPIIPDSKTQHTAPEDRKSQLWPERSKLVRKKGCSLWRVHLFFAGMALPHIEYTKEEVETWGVVFNKLKV